jgi:RNA polymerase subunit RPABC4/transcription elongation factor Spt4
VIWFPQRMLGDNTRVQTKAAFTADAELSGLGDAILGNKKSTCPECETEVDVERSSSGDISIPCPSQGCQATGITGMPCSDCGEVMPTRFTCPGCEINAPALDFLPDTEAW